MRWTRGPTIGRGSSATVSLATTVPSRELFAVKSAELSQSAHLQKEQRLLSELSASSSSSGSHPQTVRYMGHDVTEESDGKLYYNLWMEYLPNGSLYDEIRCRGGSLDELTIRSHTRKILLGLEWLHANGVVHGDVKSQNILMGSQGPKIADLGCARFVGRRREKLDDDGSMLPRSDDAAGRIQNNRLIPEHQYPIVSSGVGFSGTPMFMAPEVARNEEQGFASDVWSVGCLVIEMATGKGPWTEFSDPVSVLYKVGFSSETPEIPRRLSESGKDFLAKCLVRDPRQRWAVEALLKHPFLDEFELDLKLECGWEGFKRFARNSPSGVLDYSGVWDSIESPTNEKGLEIGDLGSSSCSWFSADERLKKLIGDSDPPLSSSSSASFYSPDWGLDADWITVRTNDDDDDDEEEGKKEGLGRKGGGLVAGSDNDAQVAQKTTSSVSDSNFDYCSCDSLGNPAVIEDVITQDYVFVDPDHDLRDDDVLRDLIDVEAEKNIIESLELITNSWPNFLAPFFVRWTQAKGNK